MPLESSLCWFFLFFYVVAIDVEFSEHFTFTSGLRHLTFAKFGKSIYTREFKQLVKMSSGTHFKPRVRTLASSDQGELLRHSATHFIISHNLIVSIGSITKKQKTFNQSQYVQVCSHELVIQSCPSCSTILHCQRRFIEINCEQTACKCVIITLVPESISIHWH